MHGLTPSSATMASLLLQSSLASSVNTAFFSQHKSFTDQLYSMQHVHTLLLYIFMSMNYVLLFQYVNEIFYSSLIKYEFIDGPSRSIRIIKVFG